MNYRFFLSVPALIFFWLGTISQDINASASTNVTGFIVLRETDGGQPVCLQFRSAMTSPTHVFVETPDGRSRQFFQKNVLEVFRLTLPEPAESLNFTNETHIAPVRSYLESLQAIASNYSCASVILSPIIARHREVLEKYNAGLRRLNGKWLTAQEYARQYQSQEQPRPDGAVTLRLKNGETLRWPRVQIQGERLVHVSEFGVEAVHRDELVDEIKWVYFPDTRPAQTGTIDVSDRAGLELSTSQNQPSSDAVNSTSAVKTSNTLTTNRETPKKTEPKTLSESYTVGSSRFFRLKDGTTHIGRVIASDEDSVTIFTTAARRHRIPRHMIIQGLETAETSP